MMSEKITGEELWEHYNNCTKELSKSLRPLGYGGVAICWALKDKVGESPWAFYCALVFIVIYFWVDALQYYIAAKKHHTYNDNIEKTSSGSDGFKAPPGSLDDIPKALFEAKIRILIVAYVFILCLFVQASLL